MLFEWWICMLLCAPMFRASGREQSNLCVQVCDVSAVVRAMATPGSNVSPSSLRWPTQLFATGNFWHSVQGTLCSTHDSVAAHFMRRSAFLLMCIDGSALMLSEREAHFIAQAFHDAKRASDLHAGSTALVHTSFASVALPHVATSDQKPRRCACIAGAAQCLHHICCAPVPVASSMPPAAQLGTAASCAAAARLFNGACSFMQLPGCEVVVADDSAVEAQDTQRRTLITAVVLGGAADVHAVSKRTGAACELLAMRGRRAHYHGSDLASVCEQGQNEARACAVTG